MRAPSTPTPTSRTSSDPLVRGLVRDRLALGADLSFRTQGSPSGVPATLPTVAPDTSPTPSTTTLVPERIVRSAPTSPRRSLLAKRPITRLARCWGRIGHPGSINCSFEYARRMESKAVSTQVGTGSYLFAENSSPSCKSLSTCTLSFQSHNLYTYTRGLEGSNNTDHDDIRFTPPHRTLSSLATAGASSSSPLRTPRTRLPKRSPREASRRRKRSCPSCASESVASRWPTKDWRR